MTTTYERIKYLCTKNGISINALENELGFGQGSIKKWNGSISPSTDSLLKIAMKFNVSLDFLSGRTDIEETASDLMSDENFLSLKRIMLNIPPSKRRNAVVVLNAAFADAYSDDQSGSES